MKQQLLLAIDMIWYCLSTERHQERKTAHEIGRLGFPVWLPEEFRYRLARHRAPSRTWHTPVLAQTLFAAIPGPLHSLLAAMEGKPTVWRDEASRAIPVPHSDIERFMAEVEAQNLRLRAYFQRLSEGIRSKKPKKYTGLQEGMAALKRRELEAA